MKRYIILLFSFILYSSVYGQLYTDEVKIQQNQSGPGKVGINIIQPTEALDIDGNVRIRDLSDGFLKVNSSGIIYNQADNFYLKKVFQYGPAGFNISGSPSGLKILRSAGGYGGHSHYGTYIIVFQFRGLQENFIFSLEKEYNSNFRVSVTRLPGRTTMVHAIEVNNPSQDDYFELQFQPGSSASNDWHTITVFQLSEGQSSGPVFSRIQYSEFDSGTQLVLNESDNSADHLFYADGKFGLDIPNPQYSIQTKGLIGAAGFVQTSDIHLKNIYGTIPGIEILKKYRDLNLYSFNFKDENHKSGEESHKHIGVIAQEVEKVFPEVVYNDHEGYKSVDYSSLSITAIAAIKEQQKDIESKDIEIKLLKDAIQKLSQRIEILENK